MERYGEFLGLAGQKPGTKRYGTILTKVMVKSPAPKELHAPEAQETAQEWVANTLNNLAIHNKSL